MTDRPVVSLGKVLRNLAAIGLLTGALAGCASTKGAPKPCPMVIVPNELGYMTVFAGNGKDLSDISYEAAVHIDPNLVSCWYSHDTEPAYIRSAFKVQFAAARGPKFTGDKASFKYFVAITGPGGERIKKQTFDVDVDLSGNKVKNISVDEIDPIKIFPKDKENGDFYRIYVGLDLTQDQLDYNKRNPR